MLSGSLKWSVLSPLGEDEGRVSIMIGIHQTEHAAISQEGLPQAVLMKRTFEKPRHKFEFG